MRAYGQVLRALLGPQELMAIATFPPQSAPGSSAASPRAIKALGGAAHLHVQMGQPGGAGRGDDGRDGGSAAAAGT